MMKVKLVKFGRKYFDPNNTTDFEKAGLRFYQGYDSAISMNSEKGKKYMNFFFFGVNIT